MEANREEEEEEEEEEQEEENGRDVDMARALLRTAWQDPDSRDWSIRKWAAEFRVGMEPQQRVCKEGVRFAITDSLRSSR